VEPGGPDSREAAQECSPRRKPWGRSEKQRSPSGAKEQFSPAPHRPAGANASNMQLTVARKNVVRNLRGFTLIELIVATAILVILTSLAIPLARVTIKRDKEHQLRRDLWDLRDAIDRYKDAADAGKFQTKVGSENYPPDLDTLVKGVDVGGKKLKFLRKIPIDPMTNTTEWGMRSMQDDPDSDSWGEQNVFDVYTKSQDTGLDGTKYKDW
jgi:general secretion pathway protein G